MNQLKRSPQTSIQWNEDVSFRLVDAVSSGFSKATQKTYAQHFLMWSRFVGAADSEAGVQLLISLSPGRANAAVAAWKAQSLTDRQSVASVNGRISAIRSDTVPSL